MTSSFPLYVRHENGALSKLVSPQKSLSFINGKEVEIKSETAEHDFLCESYAELCMGRGTEITELEFNSEFSKVIDRLLAAD